MSFLATTLVTARPALFKQVDTIGRTPRDG
jgi:hypothetical protein